VPTGDGLYAPCPCVLRDGCVGVFAVWSVIVCLGCGFPWGKVNVFFCKNVFFMFFSQNMCSILRASAFLPGENRAKQGRRCLRLGLRLCAGTDGGVRSWECGCARRGAAAGAVGSAACAERGGGVCGWECGCVQNGSLYLLACLSSIMERYDWYLLGAMCCSSRAWSTAHPGSLVCVQLLNRHSLACWKISGK